MALFITEHFARTQALSGLNIVRKKSFERSRKKPNFLKKKKQSKCHEHNHYSLPQLAVQSPEINTFDSSSKKLLTKARSENESVMVKE